MEKKDIRYLWQLLCLLFIISVTVPALPAGSICSYGMFGEIASSTVVEEATEEISLLSSRITVRNLRKGNHIYNPWLLLRIVVICIGLLACVYRLPKGDTLVARKIRMDD